MWTMLQWQCKVAKQKATLASEMMAVIKLKEPAQSLLRSASSSSLGGQKLCLADECVVSGLKYPALTWFA